MADFLLDSDVVIWYLRGDLKIADSLPDALIGATALLEGLPLYTCNPRHYPMEGLDLRALSRAPG